MKTCIRIATFLLLFCLSIPTFSQIEDKYGSEIKKVQFIARGGINFSTVVMDIDGKTEKSRVGYQVGGIADIYLKNGFFIQTGLMISSKGSKLRDVSLTGGGTADMTMNAMYLQVPLVVAYKIEVGEHKRLNIAGGPYVAYGVGGKTTGSGVYDTDTFGNNGLCNRPDVGLMLEFQFEIPQFVFIYGADTGFTKMIKRENLKQDLIVRNQTLYLGVGYKF